MMKSMQEEEKTRSKTSVSVCNVNNHDQSNNELEKGEAKDEDYIRCSRCEQQVVGGMYQCLKCAYYVHTDCLDLPQLRQHHPLHPHAALSLCLIVADESQDSDSHCCFGCPKKFSTSFLGYKCGHTGCTRKLDVKCALDRNINTRLHSHTLEFYYVNKQQQACNRKGEETVNVLIEDLAGKHCTVCEFPLIGPVKGCESCNFWIHNKCELSQNIKDISHQHYHIHRKDHSLVFLSAPPFLNRCGACGTRVVRNTFHCKECNIDFHYGCATREPSLPLNELIADKAIHHHDLTFFPDPAPFFRCYACKGYSYKTPIYRCVECDFNLHKACIKFLLTTVNNPKIHNHPLSLYEDFPFYNNKHICSVCNKLVHPNPGAYYCSSSDCNYYIHLQCVFKHEAGDNQSKVLAEVMPVEPLVRWTIENNGNRHVKYKISELQDNIEATLAKLNLERKMLMERQHLDQHINN